MFLEQLTEVVGVVISHAQGNVLYAGILLLVKQKPGLFHPDFDQVVQALDSGEYLPVIRNESA